MKKYLQSFLLVLISGFLSGQEIMNQLWSVNGGSIYALERYGDELYIGGSFSSLGMNSGCQARLDYADGSVIPGNFQIPPGSIYVIISDLQGGAYIGGSFGNIPGTQQRYLIHLLSDGSIDNQFSPQPNNAVRALALINGRLFVGGDFTNIGNQARNRLVELDITTGIPTAWDPAPNNSVYCLANTGDTLFVGGNFNSLALNTRARLAAFDLQSMQINAWDPGADALVQTMLVHQNKLYIGGSFLQTGGQNRLRIASLDILNGMASTWAPDANNMVTSLIAIGDTIIAGGTFTAIGGKPISYLAALLPDGTLADNWSPVLNGLVNCMSASKGKIYIGGQFTQVNGSSLPYLARLKENGQADNLWNANVNNSVQALCMGEQYLHVGGQFSMANLVNRSNLAAVNLITGKPTPWNPSPTGSVQDIKATKTNIYVGGAFTTVFGTYRTRIASFDRLTGALTEWNPNVNMGKVECIAIYDTLVYLGGNFSSINAQARGSAGAVSINTGQNAPFSPSIGGDVNSIEVSENHIFLGGQFSSAAGQPRSFLASFNRSTGTITNWNPKISGSSGLSKVSSISLSGNMLYVGGSFNKADTLPRSNLAAFDTSSTIPDTWDPFPTSTIYELESGDSVVYICGAFLYTGGFNADYRGCIAAIDKITGKARNWIANSNSTVESIDVYTNCEGETVFAGGIFVSINGISRIKLVGLTGVGKPISSLNTTNPTCNNISDGSIQLDIRGAGLPFQYSVDNLMVQDSGYFAGIGSGTHRLIAQGHDGCIFMDSTMVFIAEADTTFPAFDLVQDGNLISFTNQSSGIPLAFQWTFGDGDTSLVENPQHQFQSAGTYEVCLEIETNCGLKDTCTQVTILPDGLNENVNQQGLRLYPVPADKSITLEYSGINTPLNYELMDVSGRILKRGFIQSRFHTISTEQLSSGIYLFRLETGKAIQFIIQR